MHPELPAPPAPPPGTRARPRQATLLAATVAATPVTLLVAPPGYGKSTLLAAWAAGRNDLAWLTLTPQDNEPAHLWPRLGAALGVADAAHGAALVAALPAPAGPRLLVLDDSWQLTSPALLTELAAFLAALPPGLRLLLAARGEGALPLSRLRLAGKLALLGVAALRLSNDEAREWAEAGGFAPHEAARLAEAVVGWPAALRLALLARAERGAAWAGRWQQLLDSYLDEVLLDPLPAPLRDFLLDSSPLERLEPAACDALLGQPHSRAALRALLARGLFVEPEGDGTLHLHPLVRAFLHRRLHEEGARFQQRHRAASQWFEGAQQWLAAAQHALNAGDGLRATWLTVVAGHQLRRWGEGRALRHLLAELPAALWQEPELRLLAAWGRVLQGAADEAERHLERALAARLVGGDGDDPALQRFVAEGEALRGWIARLRGDLPRAIEASYPLLGQATEGTSELRALVALNLGLAHLAADDPGPAHSALLEARRAAEQGDDPFVAVWATAELAGMLAQQGELRQAVRRLEQALAAGREGSAWRPVAAVAAVPLGELLYEWDDLPAARRALLRGGRLALALDDRALASRAALALARLDAATGSAGAERFLHRARRLAGRDGPARERVEALQARLWADAGEAAPLRRWLAARPDGSSTAAAPFVAHSEALAWLALGEGDTALARLAPAEESPHGAALEALALRAAALHSLGQGQAARTALRAALAQGQGEGFLRTFLDLGRWLRPPVAALVAAEPDNAFAARLLARFAGGAAAPPTASPLSEREREVLALLAEGRTNAEIASRLFIALTTVKWHVRRILAHLNATNREAAVREAQQRGWL